MNEHRQTPNVRDGRMAISCWECRLEPSRTIVGKRFYCERCGEMRRRLRALVREQTESD
jgi:hypothetical protein